MVQIQTDHLNLLSQRPKKTGMNLGTISANIKSIFQEFSSINSRFCAFTTSHHVMKHSTAQRGQREVSNESLLDA